MSTEHERQLHPVIPMTWGHYHEVAVGESEGRAVEDLIDVLTPPERAALIAASHHGGVYTLYWTAVPPTYATGAWVMGRITESHAMPTARPLRAATRWTRRTR